MRKMILIVAILALCSAFVFAEQTENSMGASSSIDRNSMELANDSGHTSINDSGHPFNESAGEFHGAGSNASRGIGQNLSQQIMEMKEEFRAGNYTGPQGQLLNVHELVLNLSELRVNSVSAKTDLNISAETDSKGKTNISVKLSNGKERELRFMPDVASDRALKALRIKACSADNNCTIQLKSAGSGGNETIKYEMQLERHSKILGIFSKKMKVTADVDAETGDVQLKKPWWSFLATQPAE